VQGKLFPAKKRKLLTAKGAKNTAKDAKKSTAQEQAAALLRRGSPGAASGVTASAATAPAPKTTQVTIKSGDNLWIISRNLYGFGRQYTLIFEANKQLIKNPRLIYPGQVITAPVAQAQTQ